MKEKQVGFLGIDQYGQRFILRQYPRKELLEQLGYKHANKMYTELKDGSSYHSGYIVGIHWIEVFSVFTWKRSIPV